MALLDRFGRPKGPSRRSLLAAPALLLLASRVDAQTQTALMGCCNMGPAPSAGGGGGGANTWDPAHKGADVNLTGPANLVATKVTTATAETVFGTRGLNTGTPSFSVAITVTGVSWIGIFDYGLVNGAILDIDGTIYFTGGSFSSAVPFGVGDTIRPLPNFTAQTIQFSKNGGAAFPGTPISLGAAMAAIVGPFYPVCNMTAIGEVATLDPLLWA